MIFVSPNPKMKNNIITHLIRRTVLRFCVCCNVYCLVPNVVFAETYSGAGFPSVNIWYSKSRFCGFPVRVYSSVLTLVVLTYLGLSLFC